MHMASTALERERLKNETEQTRVLVAALIRMHHGWVEVLRRMHHLLGTHIQAASAMEILGGLTSLSSNTEPEAIESLLTKHKERVNKSHVRAIFSLSVRSMVEEQTTQHSAKKTHSIRPMSREYICRMYDFIGREAVDEILAMKRVSGVPYFDMPSDEVIERLRREQPRTYAVALQRMEIVKYISLGTKGRAALAAVWAPFNYYRFNFEYATTNSLPMPMLLSPMSCARALAYENVTNYIVKFAGTHPRRPNLVDYFEVSGVQVFKKSNARDPKVVAKDTTELGEKIYKASKRAIQFWRLAFASVSNPAMSAINREMEEAEKIGAALFLSTSVPSTRFEDLIAIHCRDMERTSGDMVDEDKRFHAHFFDMIVRNTVYQEDPIYLMRVMEPVNGYEWCKRMDWFRDLRPVDKHRFTRKHARAEERKKRIAVNLELEYRVAERKAVVSEKDSDIHAMKMRSVVEELHAREYHRDKLVTVHSQLFIAYRELAACKIQGFIREINAFRWRRFQLQRFVFAAKSVRDKLEFFFSDQNLAVDTFLVQNIDRLQSCVPYHVLYEFPSINGLLLGFVCPFDILYIAANKIKGLEGTRCGVRRLDWGAEGPFSTQARAPRARPVPMRIVPVTQFVMVPDYSAMGEQVPFHPAYTRTPLSFHVPRV